MSNNTGNESASATPMNETPVQPQSPKTFCKYCGSEIKNGGAFCPSCGKPQGNAPVQQPAQPMMQQPQQYYGQPMQQPAYQQSQPAMAANTANSSTHNSSTTVVVQSGGGSNGFGTAGFVFALLAFFVCWVPVVDFIVWFLGALFSFIGLFKKPRGLAIAGFILSSIVIIVILTVIGGIAALAN